MISLSIISFRFTKLILSPTKRSQESQEGARFRLGLRMQKRVNWFYLIFNLNFFTLKLFVWDTFHKESQSK